MMEYRIDHNNEFNESYSREEVQVFINNKKISLQTKIWKADWHEWKKVKDTDFDLLKAKYEPDSGLIDNLFLSIRSYLIFIDNGHFYRKPFSWLYSLIAVVNLIFPIYIFYKAFDNNIFDKPEKFVIVFSLVWIIIAFASWVSFQLWWDRKTKVKTTSVEGDEFLATPVFSHLIQTLGEWLGTWIGIVGFSVALLTTIILGDEANYLSHQIGIPYLETGFLFVILTPIYGFLIIVGTRFLAEQIRALSAIANNTRKN